MPESQNIEYKQSWHDEYLKWVCGFANAQGGTIYIGKDDADLVFQEVEEGNLINLHQAVLRQIHHKFIIKNVSFEGMYRSEKPEYPIAALREAILNALVHRNYMGAHTQIRVYDDKITFWNEGTLPEGLSLKALKRPHSSKPRNPIIADVCFKGGLIDAWGRGTIKIIDSCKQAELPEPEFTERDGGFLVMLFKNILTVEQLEKLGLNERQIKAIEFMKVKGKITNTCFQELLNVSKATATRDLTELVETFKLLDKIGQTGVGTVYILKGS